MYFAKGELRLTKEDIDNFCKDCGTCCESLSQEEKIELVKHFGQAERFHISKKCIYLINHKCISYEERPKLCKEWKCRVLEKLKDSFNNKCRID
jgi:hypothetical protein